MPWTDEYRRERTQAFDDLDQAAASAAKNRTGDTRALAIIHLHSRDAANNRVRLDVTTAMKRSGLYATADSHYGQSRSHPESENSKRDAEVAVCSDVRAEILDHRGDVAKGTRNSPYKITVDVITNRGNCNRCANDLQKLARAIASFFPDAEVKVNALYQRNNPNAIYSVIAGRRNRDTGEYRSAYGGDSAVPMHLSSEGPAVEGSVAESSAVGAKFSKDTFYPDETDHRHGPTQEPRRGGGILDSETDRSPYTTSTHDTSSARESGSDPGSKAGSDVSQTNWWYTQSSRAAWSSAVPSGQAGEWDFASSQGQGQETRSPSPTYMSPSDLPSPPLNSHDPRMGPYFTTPIVSDDYVGDLSSGMRDMQVSDEPSDHPRGHRSSGKKRRR
jgi:hypothetical protein